MKLGDLRTHPNDLATATALFDDIIEFLKEVADGFKQIPAIVCNVDRKTWLQGVINTCKEYVKDREIYEDWQLALNVVLMDEMNKPINVEKDGRDAPLVKGYQYAHVRLGKEVEAILEKYKEWADNLQLTKPKMQESEDEDS